MASNHSGRPYLLVALLAMAVATVVVAQQRSPRQYAVGGQAGWTVNFNYLRWASGKDFRVGDSLVFNYPRGAHNVMKANRTEFMTCTVPQGRDDLLTSGNDTVVLESPGNKYYFCGVASHCAELGQKLAITVRPRSILAPAGAPSPSQAATEGRPSFAFGFFW
ncbi:unnamed protein product [Linum trigynum]|uniref:Phytocyanin domain-containing protein n=1 Tax=Linum trigynum TaxID=586398 RepID=A0AAV2E8L8_9ROSI